MSGGAGLSFHSLLQFPSFIHKCLSPLLPASTSHKLARLCCVGSLQMWADVMLRGGEDNYLLTCTATRITKWWVTKKCQPGGLWQWYHHKEKKSGGKIQIHLLFKRVEIWPSTMNVAASSLLAALSHAPSGKGVLVALREIFEMIHSAGMFYAPTVCQALCSNKSSELLKQRNSVFARYSSLISKFLPAISSLESFYLKSAI